MRSLERRNHPRKKEKKNHAKLTKVYPLKGEYTNLSGGLQSNASELELCPPDRSCPLYMVLSPSGPSSCIYSFSSIVAYSLFYCVVLSLLVCRVLSSSVSYSLFVCDFGSQPGFEPLTWITVIIHSATGLDVHFGSYSMIYCVAKSFFESRGKGRLGRGTCVWHVTISNSCE